jgi:hypothetical protein
MDELTAAMTQRDPSRRPRMEEVVERYATIIKKLGSWKLRSRVVAKDEHPLLAIYRSFGHWKRRLFYIITFVPPIPRFVPDPQTAPLPEASGSVPTRLSNPPESALLSSS